MSRRLMVVYASRYGQTEKIAQRIADVAKREGMACEIAEVANASTPDDFSDVVIAGSVYFGSYARSLSRYVRQNVATLAKRHTAFVTVCNEVEQAPVAKFLRSTGWTPDTTAAFAGALRYTRYGWFIRFVASRAARAHGADADTTRDFEYTDWHAVEAFARTFLAEAKARAA